MVNSLDIQKNLDSMHSDRAEVIGQLRMIDGTRSIQDYLRIKEYEPYSNFQGGKPQIIYAYHANLEVLSSLFDDFYQGENVDECWEIFINRPAGDGFVSNINKLKSMIMEIICAKGL
jgi:hypothetical protein